MSRSKFSGLWGGAMAPDVVEDIDELRQLLQQSKRPRIQALLSAEIENLQKGAGDIRQPSVPLEKAAVVPEIRYTTLDSFSWDQDDEKVKIYIQLEGASPEKTGCSFQEWSFDVKIHDVNGKNYRSGVPKLSKPIDPELSTLIVKPKRLIVSLKKKEKARWLDLKFKEDKLKPNLEEGKDPMSGIMDLMKNMYDEGDEDMKRTIAQAWSEARGGKKPKPFGA